LGNEGLNYWLLAEHLQAPHLVHSKLTFVCVADWLINPPDKEL